MAECKVPIVSVAGGGVFFFWQIGAMKAILEERNDRPTMYAGGSSGALACALALCNVPCDRIIDTTERIVRNKKVRKRKFGLFGVWGKVVNEWREELLPENAAEICNSKLTVQVTEWRGIRKGFKVRRINQFAGKKGLIDALMASSHIPYFMNKKARRTLTAFVDGEERKFRALDGAFLYVVPGKSCLGISKEHYRITTHHGVRPDYFVSHTRDKTLKKHNIKFTDTIDKNIMTLLAKRGYEYTREKLNDIGF